MEVIKSKHNKGSPIKGLPTEPSLRRSPDKVVFGRGVGVDVYLEDLLASKLHMELSVQFGPPVQLIIRNISDKKKITLNGSQIIEIGQQSILQNNDTLTIGCVKFLVEIVQGEVGCRDYQLEFRNFTDEPSPIPSNSRSEAENRRDPITSSHAAVSSNIPSSAYTPTTASSAQYASIQPSAGRQYIPAGQVSLDPLTMGHPSLGMLAYPPNVYQQGYFPNPLMMPGYPTYADIFHQMALQRGLLQDGSLHHVPSQGGELLQGGYLQGGHLQGGLLHSRPSQVASLQGGGPLRGVGPLQGGRPLYDGFLQGGPLPGEPLQGGLLHGGFLQGGPVQGGEPYGVRLPYYRAPSTHGHNEPVQHDETQKGKQECDLKPH